MSLRMNQYIIQGVRLDYKTYEGMYDDFDEYLDDGYEKGLTHKNGLAVLFDGMNGQWIFIGRILHKSNIDEPLEGVFMFEEVIPERKEMLEGLIALSFPRIEIPPSGIRTYLITEYH